MTLLLDTDLLKAKIFHGLKSLHSGDDTLNSRYLEIVISECFNFKHVGDSAYYADGVNNTSQLSIKTRTLQPDVPKRKQGRDFQSNPEKFLGPQINTKHQKWTNGLEIVQRRQQVDFQNDSTAPADVVGNATLISFKKNINESLAKYRVTDTWEVICVHGYDKTKKYYLVSLYWKEYEFLNPECINWLREKNGVSGYMNIDNVSKKICERINGNAKREATCFKEYKDLTKYKCSANIKLPLPDPWQFDKQAILEEINLKETQHATNLFQ
jgi:hypothetical protein